MGVSKHIAFLCSVIVAVLSAQPNCEPDNQFRSYCFSIEYCNNFICQEHNCGRFILNAKTVKIKDAKIIPKCAFSNANELRYIHGANKNIRVIASGAFVNLPQMESLILPFNFIRELHHGTFKNVRLSTLDLSWNRIVYVQEGAFEGIQGLQHLNLSRNELLTLPVQRLSPSLISLNLSYNFFRILALNYARFPNLINIDLSHNDLENVALYFEKRLEEIDLGHNHLKNIDLFEVQFCEKLKISSNNFSSIPEFLKYSSIKSISLYPNPWKCAELQELWSYLQNNFITVEQDSRQSEGGPICSDEFVLYSTFSKLTDFRQCDDDAHCDPDMICRGSYCWNPCKQNVCDPGSTCKVENHKFECSCPKNHMRDPRNIHSGCVEADCFLDSHCSPGSYCNFDHLCRVIPQGPSGSAQYGAPQRAPESGGFVAPQAASGSGGFGASVAVSGPGEFGAPVAVPRPGEFGAPVTVPRPGEFGVPGPGEFGAPVGVPESGGFGETTEIAESTEFGETAEELTESGVTIVIAEETSTTTLGPGQGQSEGANATIENLEQPWWYYEIPIKTPGKKPKE